TRVDTEAVGKLCVSLVTGASSGTLRKLLQSPGSRPYRRRAGDCSRVLTCVRWVKLRAATGRTGKPPARRGRDRNPHGRPANTQKPLLNVTNRLALRNKPV